MKSRINCNDKLWKQAVEAALAQGKDVELINLDEIEDGDFCEHLAEDQGMEFSVDAETGYGRIYKPQ